MSTEPTPDLYAVVKAVLSENVDEIVTQAVGEPPTLDAGRAAFHVVQAVARVEAAERAEIERELRAQIADDLEAEMQRGFPQPVTAALMKAKAIVRGGER